MKLFHLENSIVCGEVRQLNSLTRVTLTLGLNQTDPVRYQMPFHVIPREFLCEFAREIDFAVDRCY